MKIKNNRAMKMIPKSRKGAVFGFTLIELLIAVSIISIVALALGSTFAAGLKVYKRIQLLSWGKIDALISLEKMGKDLRNMLNVSTIDFSGDAKKVSFAGIIKKIDSKEKINVSLGRILYYIDKPKAVLIREEQDYSQGVSESELKKGSIIALAHINELDFSYYYYDTETESYEWKDSWKIEEKGIPLGVRVNLTFKGDAANETLVRTMFIPTAR